jgi:regulator of RNase E activity RraA
MILSGGTARTARGRIVEEDFNCPVRVGDVTVEPGDLVIADASAIVFAPRGRTEEVLADAERITEKERLMMEAMVAGEPVGQVMTADYESMPDDRG